MAEDWQQDAEQAMLNYEIFEVAGTGVYGTVHRARDRRTGDVVAMKRLHLEDAYGQGVPAHVIREVSVLRDLEHPNIVRLQDVHSIGASDYTLVFEFLDQDLYRFLKTYREAGTYMAMDQLRAFSRELVNGVAYCHTLLVVHRDLKPQNVLIKHTDGQMQLKICDFGLARVFSFPLRPYSHDVVTLWYRAPEILLGAEKYGPEVDVWSAACVIAEMGTNIAAFTGDSELGTLFKIFRMLGTPNSLTWPGVEDLPYFLDTFPQWQNSHFESIVAQRAELGNGDFIGLLEAMLTPCPAARLTARRAKQHPFLRVN